MMQKSKLDHYPRLTAINNGMGGIHEANVTLTQLAAQLGAALAGVEWADNSGDEYAAECPWCQKQERFGHAKNCPRQAALAAAKGQGIKA